MKQRLLNMRHAFLAAVLCWAVGLLGHSLAESPSPAQKVQIESKLLKQSRSFTISKPDDYDNGTDRYPVLYVLDGEDSFEYTAAIVRFLENNDRIPEMIVVAIDSGDVARRTHDLTPPSQVGIENRFSPGNGGADAFLGFISDELIPYVEGNYRTRPYRMLVGHSFGGLFVIHTLGTKPALFNAYIAIDPTADWNKGAAIDRVQRTLSGLNDLQADLFMTAANHLGSVTPGVQRLAAVLDETKLPQFRWYFEWMREETHLSVPLPSIYSGLSNIFDGWYVTDPLRLFDEGGIEAVHRHFREGAKRYGYERTTPAFTISLVVADLAKEGRLEEASAVLLHDPKAYPPPWNQLDALARAYAEKGNVQQAIRYYKLSLQENPNNDWAKRKLAEMGANSDTESKTQPR